MKKTFLISGLFLLALAVPAISFAQFIPSQTTTKTEIPGPTGNFNSTDDPKDSGFQLVSCNGIDDPRTEKEEVECTFNHAVETFQRIIKFVLYLMIPIILGMIVYVGFTYITANGDAGKLAKAKSMIIPILLGVFFILAAWLIVFTLLDFLLADKLGDGITKSNIVPAKNK
jgi:hypothetical protein